MFIHQRDVLQALLVLYFLLSYDGVQGEIKLSKQEELALDKQLKLSNKSAIKTIKTEWGDTYDCVDFYKQPAFDHPLLKNHNFNHKMKPTLPTIHQIPSTSTIDISSRIRSKKKSCPLGTVPIKRVTKEDLIRQRSMPPPENVTFEAQLSDVDDPPTNPGPNGKYYRAMVQTSENPNNKFAGAGILATVWSVDVQGQQNSACRLKVQKGSNKLQVGWRVDPTLYGDSKTRFFIHMQVGNTQCFNTMCHGFIIVNSSNYLDAILDPVSQIGGDQYTITAFISRDLINGNWWLLLGNDQIAVGFWPSRIFTELNDFATNVEWGGVAYTPPGSTYTPMGTGFWPHLPDRTLDAWCKGFVLDNKGDETNVDTSEIVDTSLLYQVMEESNLVFYGGPEDPNGYV